MTAAVAVASALLLSALQAQAATLSLEETLAAARGNLDVSIAARAAAAARADIAAADHAPLPQLSGKLSQIDLQNGIGPGNLVRDKRIDKSVGLDWTWERGGKRALRTEAARQAAGAADADVDEVRIQQALAAQAAFFDLLAAQERREQLGEIEQGTRRLADVAGQRVKAGDLAVQDAARAGIEAERARADQDGALLDLQRAQFTLAQLIGRDAEARDLVARDADWPAASTLAQAAEAEALAEQRGDVRAAAARVQAAQAALSGSQAQRKSDVTWGASVDHYPGTSTRQVELRFAMPLTWGYHYEGEVGRSQAQLDAARDTLEKARRVAIADLRKQRAELESAWQRWRRYDGEIVPRSREVAQRAELAYGKGAMPLTDLLDARRTLRTALLEALNARTDLAKAQGAWLLRTTKTPS